MTTGSTRKDSAPRHFSRGFGSFELVWVLLVVALLAIVVRLGGWLLGVEIRWGFSALIATMTLVGLLMLAGIVASMRAPAPEDARSKAATGVRSEPAAEEDECVQVFYDEQQRRRVRILLRRTGTFYFQEESLREEASELYWIPVKGAPVGFYDSEATAIREARASIDWLPVP